MTASRSFFPLRATGTSFVNGIGRRIATGAVGLSGALLIHMLLLAPFLLGAGDKRHRLPDSEGAPSNGAPAMTVLFLENSSDPAETSGPPRDAGILAPIPLLVPVGDIRVGEHPVTFDAQEDIDASAKQQDAAGDATARAALFGRYLGQITARISRAWLRPRSSIGGDRFSCWVQVEQDARGNVGEITLKSCNGSTAWQLSLVHAIESASPLPAPPDASVFTKTLTFEMGADAFDPQRSPDGYEQALASAQNGLSNH